jgi:hypothetical protein
MGVTGGLPTEWEISTPDPLLKRIICSLPRVPGVDMSGPEHADYYRASIMLPQGCSFADVEPVIDSLVRLEPASDNILEAIEKAAVAAGYEVRSG